MNEKNRGALAISLRDFFTDYLVQLRGVSSHTILSYRDSMKLFLRFVIRQKKISIKNLTIEHLNPDEVIAFLAHLEEERRNSVGTRNIRLAAIHCFFRYLASKFPEHLHLSQRILAIPFKRNSNRMIEYLEHQEIKTILESIDRNKKNGTRDYALFLLMYNTGARVQETVNLKTTDLCLTKPFSVHIFGKGRKERTCPIWKETADALNIYVQKKKMDLRKPEPLFLNHQGNPLTRFGVRYILKKYIQKTVYYHPRLKDKRLHPHSIRHSTALHLLKSGVDLSTIANWLGHVSINTTNKYVTIDMEIKRKAIAKATPLGNNEYKRSSMKDDADILAWLESL